MVVKYQDVSQVKNDEIHELKRQISNLNESNGRLQTEIDIYNNRLLTRATKEAKQAIDNNSFAKVMIVTYEEWENKKKLGGLDAAFLEEIEKIEEYRDARAEDFAVCGANLLAGEIKGLDYALKNIKKFGLKLKTSKTLKI